MTELEPETRPPQTRPMHIDAITLSDLAVFESPDGGAGLFDLIDRTFTGRGRRMLRRRFEQPISDVALLRRTQDAVRFLMGHPQLVRLAPEPVERVDRYLNSNIVPASRSPFGGRLEYAWIRLRHGDLLQELRSGIHETLALLDRLGRLGKVIEDHDPPDMVARLATELRRVAAAAPRGPVGSARLLAVDRECRERLRSDIEHALGAMADLDALNALAQATATRGWTLPELVDSGSFLLDATGAFHPFLANPVPNPVSLSTDRPLIVLTGPNMAGKTTYLRCVGVLVFLAQVGMGVPAARARLTPVEALITSLNPADNLRAGLSYFLSEVLRVKAAAAVLAEERRALVLFDEVFKGTNVKDALEASAEVIRGFAHAGRSACIFASHLSELSAVLENEAGIRFRRFDAQVVDGVPRYRHEIEDGVSDKRLGLLLLRQEGIPDLLARIRQNRGP